MSTRLNFAAGDTLWEGFQALDINGAPGTTYLDMNDVPYPYEDDSVDLIMLSHALQMMSDGEPVFPDHERIFREFHRILRPGGWLRVDENPLRIYRPGESIAAADRQLEALSGFPEHRRIARTDFLEMLQRVGFRKISEIDPWLTRIPASDEVQAAIVGNHLDHASFALEACK